MHNMEESDSDFSYKRTEHFNGENTERLKDRYHDILGYIGEDPEREGLADTPERMAKAIQFWK